ncbi:MAG: leucyl aminopeptidase [Legionella sp.]|nr:leucyl aminopeptidase [Legionella sp.]
MNHGRTYQLIATPTLTSNECLVLGVFADRMALEPVTAFDQSFSGLISRLHSQLQEAGDWVWQADVNGHRLMLIHCGSAEIFNTKMLSKRLKTVASYLLKQRIGSATLCFPAVNDAEMASQVEQTLIQLEDCCYQSLDFKSKDHRPYTLKALSLHIFDPSFKNQVPVLEKALTDAKAIAKGICYTKTLADLPANICTPRYLENQAIELAQVHNTLSTKSMGPAEMRAMGMGTLLAVAQGSVEEPRLIELHYKGTAKNVQPLIFVGKGITFDSGGISLKPADKMEEMKYDMAGAASVLGILKTCAALNLPLHVIGILACAENMPSGTAVKPGDIVTSMSGQTVEITNTDAEGRLVLADALTYAERFNPEWVIDMATLTGAMIIALGHLMNGLMSPDDALAQQILDASLKSHDQTWRLPLDEAYHEALSSPIADCANAASNRAAGSITAATFLAQFTKKYRWAHLDIAGTAWVPGAKRHATGRPVPLLVQLLRNVAATR